MIKIGLGTEDIFTILTHPGRQTEDGRKSEGSAYRDG
jgi:hypothetical protein